MVSTAVYKLQPQSASLPSTPTTEAGPQGPAGTGTAAAPAPKQGAGQTGASRGTEASRGDGGGKTEDKAKRDKASLPKPADGKSQGDAGDASKRAKLDLKPASKPDASKHAAMPPTSRTKVNNSPSWPLGCALFPLSISAGDFAIFTCRYIRESSPRRPSRAPHIAEAWSCY